MNRRIAFEGVLQFLQNNQACALSDEKTIALEIKRAGGLFRTIVLSRKRPEKRESRDTNHRHHAVGASSDHQISPSPADGLERFPDCLRGGSACALNRSARSTKVASQGQNRGHGRHVTLREQLVNTHDALVVSQAENAAIRASATFRLAELSTKIRSRLRR